ncbi:MAG: hypothetical protein FWF59_08265 [Turicibacter sp.]|nr:hypothetical protein [Turicibacter sp.]
MSYELIQLYEAAREINKTDWWHGGHRHLPLIYKQPRTGEKYYIHFVSPHLIRVHIGEAGRYSYQEYGTIMKADPANHPLEVDRYVKRQEIMEVEFFDRSDLPDLDYDRIKMLGLSFRGKKQWPAFIRMTPGGLPQPIEDEGEIIIFREILRALPSLLKRHFGPIPQGTEFTYHHAEMVVADLWDWDGWESPSCYAQPYLNELKAHRVKKLRKIGESWEAIQFFLDHPALDHKVSQQPFFPTTTLLGDPTDETVVWHHLTGHSLTNLSSIPDGLADFLIENAIRPRSITVEDGSLYEQLQDFCQKTGIELKRGETPFATQIAYESVEAARQGNGEQDELEFLSGMMLEGVEMILEARPGMFKPIEREILRKVFTESFFFFVQERGEMLPHWSADTLTDLLNSGVLNHAGPPKIVRTILEKLFRILGEEGVLETGNSLLQVLKNHK